MQKNIFILALCVAVTTLPLTAFANTLCVKNSFKASVSHGKATVKIPTKFTTTTTTCPSGYSEVVNLGHTFSSTLPSGDSLAGMWNVSDPTGGYSAANISFALPLASEPLVEMVRAGTTGSHCLGNSDTPTAPAGYLCLYEGIYSNIEAGNSFTFYKPSGASGASKYGTAMFAHPAASGTAYYSWGSWAVTAQ